MNSDLLPSSLINFTYDGRALRCKGKMAVGNDVEVRKEIMVVCHDSSVGGHLRFLCNVPAFTKFVLLEEAV